MRNTVKTCKRGACKNYNPMGNEQMKILKVLNVISIILSFGCTLAAVLFLASVGSDSNFLNGIAVILSLFLFVFIGISGVIVESYFKDDNVIQKSTSAKKAKHPFFIMLSKALLIFFLVSFVCSLVIFIRSSGCFRKTVSLHDQDWTQPLPVNRIVEADSYFVVDSLGKAEPKNEKQKQNAGAILPEYFLIILEPESHPESPYLILALAGKTNAAVLNENLNKLSEKSISSYLREISDSEKAMIDAYIRDHSDVKSTLVLPYCMSDVYIEGLTKYSVFRPVEVFVLCLILSFVSLVQALRILRAVRPSLADFLAPRPYRVED